MRVAVTTRDVIVFAPVVILIGILHRGAAVVPWADDRELSVEPAWLQLAAPAWHATIPASSSPANTLTRIVDPFTAASTAGDARGLAALLAAAAAALMLISLRQLRVPSIVAAILPASLTSAILPVSAATIVAHTLQSAAAAGMLAVITSGPRSSAWRLGTLAAITVLGALNHAAFLAFAAGIWLIELIYCRGRARVLTLAIALTALIAAVVAAAWSLSKEIGLPAGVDMPQPTLWQTAGALLTGRFDGSLQPQQHGTFQQPLSTLPPLIVIVALAAIACREEPARRAAVACIVSSLCVIAGTAWSWLPDPSVGAAPARLAVAVLGGLGAAALWDDAPRLRVLAVAASAVIGLGGFLGGGTAEARALSAQVHAFVASATNHIGESRWSADHLSTARTLLAEATDSTRRARLWSGVTAIRAVAEDERFVPFVRIDTPRQRWGVWLVPYELPYPSADSFVDAHQADQRWLAIAIRGSSARGGFCQDLLDRLRIGDSPPGTPLAVVAHPHRHSVTTSRTRLDVPFGTSLPGEVAAPAHFAIELSPVPKIRVNENSWSLTAGEMLLTTFDAREVEGRSWPIASCEAPAPPQIVNRRLLAAHVLRPGGEVELPHIPVVLDEEVDVVFSDAGEPWFGTGWHRPESRGNDVYRWTAASAAFVNVLAAHQQPLRVRLEGQLASARPGNTLRLSWNGVAMAPSAGDVVHEWTIDRNLVRRGLNILGIHVTELVSPRGIGASSDDRMLGMSVNRLAVIPIRGARAADSSTDRH
jgi:hypothetical protein